MAATEHSVAAPTPYGATDYTGGRNRGDEKMKKIFVGLLLLLFTLLGVSRTPEAQVGEALTAAMLAGNVITVGGCAHAALKSPAPSPMAAPQPPAEIGG